MLTIRKIQVAVGDHKGALAAAAYPLEATDSPEAFLRPGESTGQSTMWIGSQRALDELGLERGARPDVAELAAALEGRDVDAGVQVRRPGSKPAVDRDGRPKLTQSGEPYQEAVVNSFDLTLGAPKSYSAVWSAADGELRAAMSRAMLEAANAAVEHLTSTRNVVSGNGRGHGFAASTALHVTARTARGEAAPSPHLHVHVHLVGVLDSGGHLRTPHAEALFKHSAPREGGAVFRAVLAENLRELGFEIEWGTGKGRRYFEIAGVPAGLCERLSGRTRDVEQWAALEGAHTSRDRAVAALLTRTDKGKLTPETIQAVWAAHHAEFGFDTGTIERLRSRRAPQRSVEDHRDVLREEILERLWADGPAVSIGAVRSIAFELAPMGISLADAEHVLAQMQTSGELIPIDGWRVTSRDIRAREQYVQAVATEAARAPSEALSATAVARGVAVAERDLDGHTLLDDQWEAVKELTKGAGWACLTGRAGTGKGPVLQAVAEAHRQEGWRVIACAVDGATAVRLGHQVRSPALTLEQFAHRLRSGDVQVDARTLIVVDEASKVGLRHWAALARLREQTGVRLIPVGDVGQIGAIESPGMLDVMLKNEAIPTARLDDVLRHRNPDNPAELHPWLDQYQKALYEGRADEAIKLLRDERAITMHQAREDAMRGLVDTWDRRRSEHGIDVRDTVLIVYGSNDDVDTVNRLAQGRRIANREISGDGVAAVDRDYAICVGDVVMLREAAYQPAPARRGERRPDRVENGTMGLVTRIDKDRDRVWVELERPEGGVREAMIDMGRLRADYARAQRSGDETQRVPALRLAYAGHPFPMQGATFKYVGSLWGHWSQRKEETYSGDTRAKYWLDVHTDRESMGLNLATDDKRYAKWAERLKVPWHRLASITYEETPDATVAIGVGVPELLPPGAQQRAAPGSAVDAVRATGHLERYQEMLGAQRFARLSERADVLAKQFTGLSDAAIDGEAAAGREALAWLSLTAREVLRLERRRALLGERIERARGLAGELSAEASGMSGFRARHGRADLKQAARAQSARATRDAGRLKAVVDKQHELRAAARDWIESESSAFARGVAAERELARRGERSIGIDPHGPERGPEAPVDAAIEL